MSKSKKRIPDDEPYMVDPDDLLALGIDRDVHFRTGGRGFLVGCMLYRKRDAELILRLQSMREPHGTMQ